jgi:hypothetical protein
VADIADDSVKLRESSNRLVGPASCNGTNLDPSFLSSLSLSLSLSLALSLFLGLKLVSIIVQSEIYS